MLSFYFAEQKYKKKTRVSCCLVPRRFLRFSTVVAKERWWKSFKNAKAQRGTKSSVDKRLRKDDCRKWWGTVIRLTGSSGNALSYSLECGREVLNEMALADILCFRGWYDIPPLDATTLLAFLSTDFCSEKPSSWSLHEALSNSAF